MSDPQPLVSVTVPGLPQPQGSAKAYRRGQRVIVTSDNPRLAAWRDRLAYGIVASRQAAAALHGHPVVRHDGPVRMSLVFRLVRPKSAAKRAWPTTRPDLDKLVRAVGDAMTDAGVWRDDSQLVALEATKVYREAPAVDITAWAQEA